MEEKNVMTDEQLAIDYMAGDNKAFDELLRRYKNKVFSSVYNMINDRLAAEDVFQDIFIRIIVGLRENRYTSKGYFKFWVATITRNAIIDYHRKNKILLADVNEDNDLCTLKGQDEFINIDKPHITALLSILGQGIRVNQQLLVFP